MRLSDIGRGDTPLPAEIEAELDALDAALRGEERPAGMEGLSALVGDLRAERAHPGRRVRRRPGPLGGRGVPPRPPSRPERAGHEERRRRTRCASFWPR